MINNIAWGLSFLTLVGQVWLIFLLLVLATRKKEPEIFRKNGLILSFLISLTATLGSLFYSEIAGYEPCVLCWYQRILMYPQVILLFTAILKKEGRRIADYSIGLSFLGAILAGFHYYLQIKGTGSFVCSNVGYSANCSEAFFMDFGFVTIPLSALTAFLLIMVLMFFEKNKKRR